MAETPIEEQARLQFEEQLESWLAETETKEVLKAVATEKPALTVDAVRATVGGRWEELKERLETALQAWEKASKKLAKARSAVDERVSPSRLRVVGILTLIALTLGSGGIVWLGVNVDPTLFLLFIYLISIVPSYWLTLKGNRTQAQIEFSVDIRERALERAENRFSAALGDQVAVCIRETINSFLTSFEKGFRLFDQRGLRELADPEREVSTRSSKALSDLLISLDSGSIGLAGPRGAGKTTLIDSFARGRSVPFEKERMGLVVSAPVKYDAREFVLHLFGSLCRQVVGDSDLEEAQLGQRALNRRHRAAAARLAMWAGGLMLLVGTAMLIFKKTRPEGPIETGISLLAVGFAAAYAGFIVRVINDRKFARQAIKLFSLGMGGEGVEKGGRADPLPARTPEQIALERLEEIGYQQSISSGWSGDLKLPFGLSLGGDSTMTSARTPWSLPEAVEEFRRFASSQFGGRYVVIGIDELDKMESDEAAREFLNDIKGVFGVHNCYYLVSVSEEAMSTFERRGLPFRDVFDSSFDAIQTVGYLTLDESRDLLESRVTGLPVPFQCLCHALAGGLPRDLIRVTRELVQHGGPSATLAELSLLLVRNEHRGKMAAAISAIRTAPWPQRNWLVTWLNRQTSSDLTPARLREWSLGLEATASFLVEESKDEKIQQCKDVVLQVASFNYLAATVVEFFGLGDVDLILRCKDRDALDPIGALPVETLAAARQQFGLSPSLSWATVGQVRRMTRLAQWPDPSPLAAAHAGLANSPA